MESQNFFSHLCMESQSFFSHLCMESQSFWQFKTDFCGACFLDNPTIPLHPIKNNKKINPFLQYC